MTDSRLLKSVIIIFALLMFFGCVGVSPRPEEMKAQVTGYQLPKLPDEGKAMVYVVRPTDYFGAVSLHVYIDNKESEIGSTKGTQYICFNIAPGEHTIFSKGENWSEINISAKPGEVIFLQQEPAMPILREARNKLLKLQDYEGRYYVKTLSQRGNIASYGFSGSKAPVVSTSASTIPKGEIANTPTNAQLPQTGQASSGLYTGTVAKLRFVKPWGFRWIINFKMEVVGDNGGKDIFYIWRSSKMVGPDGNDIPFDRLSGRLDGKRVEIEHFIIEDDKGGYPDGSGFSYEVGQKGVRSLHFLN
jgi:hypothetical protein